MRNKFKLSRVAASVAVAITGIAASQAAFAGAGFATVTGADGLDHRKATFFAYSPSGVRTTAVPESDTLGIVGQNTGTALRKFVDKLPVPGRTVDALTGLYNGATVMDGTTAVEKYIPVAVSSKWVNPQGFETTHDYYEIGIVEYTEKFHSDLRKASLLRGYVQIDHAASNGRTALTGSKALALYYPNSSGKVAFAVGDTVPSDAVAIMINGTDATGKLTGSKVQAKVVDAPHFLGPVIAATKDTPTRMKVLNLLPVGRAEFVAGTKQEVDPATNKLITVPTYNVTKRNGDLFLPVDKSILGAGVGPDGLTEYTQNRASVHLHGGDTPWISDGTPHQWITPAGENDATVPGSLASAFNDPLGFLDPNMLPNYIKGVSTQNVPDMNDPGDGALTLYYPNGHTARMEWYHDHTFGSTRLNVYAGMASAYLVTDPVEIALTEGSGAISVGSGAFAKPITPVLPPASRTIPLVMQDRTFVPDDIALQDAHWNTTAWGQPGDSWFPHVYETVQDPNQANNWNSVGRWHYGPWFWPVFPALYNLPEGTYSPAGYENSVTTTPEGWHDTPVINGVAYPTLEVDPTTYRFRLLNATNDRMLTFNLFEAQTDATLADGTVVTSPIGATEINMVPAGAPLAADACAPGQRRPTPIGASTKFCTPETWPTDGRIGGVPNPAGVGPTIYQVANESGWLPKVAVYEPTPINYIQDKGRIVVLNVDLGNSGLLIAPAERADVVIDFSQYAGKTLLVYNDSGAPVPAGDPRNDLFTGVGDQTQEGGQEDTKPGYGPNTRTMMQIKVKATATGSVSPLLDPAVLNTSISNAYFSDPARRPVVAQDVYAGFDTTDTWKNFKPADMYGDIYLGSLKNPTFQFTPGTPSTGLANVLVPTTQQGSGYIVAPTVSIAAPTAGGVAATGVATMKVEKLNITDAGKGYTTAPLMSFSGGGGNGLMANAFLRVDTTSGVVTAPGAGYNPPSGRLVINFTPAPGATVNNPTPGVTPTGYATVAGGKVTGIVISTPGKGYSSIPLITITNKDSVSGVAGPGTGAKATVTGLVDSIVLYGTDNTTPAMNALTSGGGGYVDLTPGVFNVNIRGGLPIDPLTGLAKAGTVNAVAYATGKVFDITLTNPGAGYAAAEVPAVTLSQAVVATPFTAAVPVATAAATAGAKASYLVKTKTIQELFDPTYGRLNATLGIELPFTSALTQTTIPLGYVDETTEKFADGETQIWKITHNGVDSHPVHFHLLDVQVINRVGWDGFIQPIEPKEMGWKETVMMSPLEDIIVAVRAKKPVLPGFGVPLSQRLMDPTQPEGSPFGFTQIDPLTGNPAVVTNASVNFGWEYVWHCHILGHEENDFMRPIHFAANEAMPASTAPTVVATATGTTATVGFTDHSDSEYKFELRRADVSLAGVVGSYAPIATELALTLPSTGSSFTDATLAADHIYSYVVAAVGGYAEAVSTPQTVDTYAVPAAPVLSGTTPSATQVVLTWTAGKPSTSYSIVRTGGAGTVTFTAAGTATGYTDNTAVANTMYNYTVTVKNAGKSAVSNTVQLTTPAAVLAAPSGLVGYLSGTTSAVLTWTDTTKTENSFRVYRSVNNGAYSLLTTVTRTAAQTTASGGTVTYTNTGLTNGSTYSYYVVGVQTAPAMTSLQSNTFNLTVGAPAAPSAVTATNVVRNMLLNIIPLATDAVTLSWTQVGNAPASSVTVQYANNAAMTGATTVTANNVNGATTATVNVNRGTGTNPNPATVYIRMTATNPRGTSANSTVIGPITLK